MENDLIKQQVQEFFAQEWRKRPFVVFLDENNFAKRIITKQKVDQLDNWRGDAKGIELALRWLVKSQPTVLAIREARKFIGKKNTEKEKEISFLSEKHLEAALASGILREPDGSFKLKTVYAGHPYLKPLYTPVAFFHEMLFKEKAREIVRICSSLGASKLKVTYARQQIKSGSGRASAVLPLEIPVPAKINVQNDSSSYQEIWHEATYNPSHKPTLPPEKELIWYETEPQWKQLVEDRLTRGLSTINLQIQSRQDYHVNRQLAAGVQSLGLSLGGEWIEHTQLLLTVEGEFIPLRDLQ